MSSEESGTPFVALFLLGNLSVFLHPSLWLRSPCQRLEGGRTYGFWMMPRVWGHAEVIQGGRQVWMGI